MGGRRKIKAAGLKIAIIASSFNEFITKRLHAAAREALLEQGADERDISTFWVPGAYEIPSALAAVADTGEYDAAVCLGTVIKGETPHFDHVAREAASGIARVSVDNRLPVGFGVITAATTDQALERAGGKRGNKGREAALAAIDMVHVVAAIKGKKKVRLRQSES